MGDSAEHGETIGPLTWNKEDGKWRLQSTSFRGSGIGPPSGPASSMWLPSSGIMLLREVRLRQTTNWLYQSVMTSLISRELPQELHGMMETEPSMRVVSLAWISTPHGQSGQVRNCTGTSFSSPFHSGMLVEVSVHNFENPMAE